MNKQPANQIHHIACNLCEAICGLEIILENGQVKSIKGDKLDPVSKGHICPKAVALQDIYNDPDRLKTPLKKTDDGWQQISWKQAWNEVTDQLKSIQARYGKDSVAVYLGNPTVHNLEAMLFAPMFTRSLRTKNRYSATSVDQLPEQLVSQLMFGHSLLIPLPDLDRTDYLVIFGANPVVSNGSLMTAPGVTRKLKGIRQRNGTVVVIDPRKSETAAIADKHLFIKPGSDVLMLLALLHVVFAENLQTLGNAAAYTRGLHDIEKLVADFPPERVADITGVAADEVRILARGFCNAKTACCYGRIGVSTQEFGTLTQWLIMVFNIVTGNLDKAGGTMFSTPAIDILTEGSKKRAPKRKNFAAHRSRVRNLPSFSGEFPVATLAEEITTPGDGQIRALVTNAGNPVLSTPNGNQLDAAMSRLDFMVAIDIYINESSRHADIILPPLSSLERPHYDLVFHTMAIRNSAKFSKPVFKADKTQRSDKQIFLELSWRMQTGNWFKKATGWIKKEILLWLGSEWMVNKGLKIGPFADSHRLSLKKLMQNPHGIDLGPMQPCLPGRLFTADKVINLLPDECLRDMARMNNSLLEPKVEPDSAGLDLLLIGRRDPRTNNSWLHNSHRMVKGKKRCLALLHPQDAAARNIRDGDDILVQSRVGAITIPASVSDDMMPGVISIPHGWGHQLDGVELNIASQHAGVNTNILTDDYFLDGLSGNAVLNGIKVSIARLNTQEQN